MHKVSLLAGAAVLGLLGLASPCAAQAVDAVSLEPVTVTAQRQAQNLQDVPITVTAVSGQTVSELNLRDPRDLALVTPGFTYQSSFANSAAAIFIRGVGIGDFNANTTGAVGVYRDDVFIGANSGKLIDLFDAEDVEVLKGPQGTLYGRNATAGALKFTSRKPTDTLQADALASYGSFNERIFEAGVGGPVFGDLVKARIAGFYEGRDGTTLNRVTGHHVNTLDDWHLRAIVDVTPSQDMLLRLIVHGGQNHDGGHEFQSRGAGVDLNGNPTFLPDGTPLDAFGYADTDHDKNAGDYDVEGKDRIDSFGASLNLVWSAPGAELTSITAWESVQHHLLEDTDATPNNVVTGYYVDKPSQISQEVRLRSTSAGRLSWLVGAYYFREHLPNDSAFDILRVTRDPNLPMGGFDPTIGNGYQRFPSDEVTRSLAAFGQAEFALTDSLTAVGGLRYTQDRVRLDYRSFFDEPFGVFPLIDVHQRRTDDDLSYRAGLNWRLGRTLVYATSSKGYNSGGFPSGLANYPSQVAAFKPERLYAQEIGVKTATADERLRFDAAAYWYDYKDLQVFVFDTSGLIPLQRKINAGDARIYGLEATVAARPVSHLEVSLGANLMHAEYRRFTALAAQDDSGNQLVNAPNLSLTGSVAYRLPLGPAGAVSARLDGLYQSAMFLNPDNSPDYRVSPYGLLNGRLAWDLPDGRTEVALFARNLTNTRAVTYVSPIITQFEVNYTDPRVVGVQLTYRLR